MIRAGNNNQAKLESPFKSVTVSGSTVIEDRTMLSAMSTGLVLQYPSGRSRVIGTPSFVTDV